MSESDEELIIDDEFPWSADEDSDVYNFSSSG
jgi:hypothetical protein